MNGTTMRYLKGGGLKGSKIQVGLFMDDNKQAIKKGESKKLHQNKNIFLKIVKIFPSDYKIL